MLRITTILDHGSPAILKLEGKLLEPWISELQQAYRRARRGTAPAAIDLSGISYVDVQGTIAIREFIRRGVAVTGCPPLVAELLKENDQ